MSFTPVTLLKLTFWIIAAILIALLSFNALHYYNFDLSYGILKEKTEELENVFWASSLYAHMFSGVICMVIPLLLFNQNIFRINPRWHRILGKIYVVDIIVVVVPSGFYMAFYAKGGFYAQLGFIVQALGAFVFTYLAFYFIRKGHLKEHISMMKRSYAVVMAALTFRLIHIILYELKVPYEINYATSQWLSLFINMFIAELSIVKQIVKLNLVKK